MGGIALGLRTKIVGLQNKTQIKDDGVVSQCLCNNLCGLKKRDRVLRNEHPNMRKPNYHFPLQSLIEKKNNRGQSLMNHD